MIRNSGLILAIIGCGRMGIGIAQVFAYEGFTVFLIDAKERGKTQVKELFDSALEQINKNLFFLSRTGILEKKRIPQILDNISVYRFDQMETVLPDCDIIFEAVPEVLEIKKMVFTRINESARSESIIASTTSTFLVDQLAEYITCPERFLCTHWLNPAFLMPLVEMSPGRCTSLERFQLVFSLLESIGKIPIKCNPSPGFIVPRIQALAMNEAARLVEEGVASPEDIDKASRFGFGIRFAVLGLLEFIDWGGGDILYYADNYLSNALGKERFSPPESVVSNMENGHIGFKSGKGFFDYSKRDLARYQEETLVKFVDLLKHLGLIRYPHANIESL